MTFPTIARRAHVSVILIAMSASYYKVSCMRQNLTEVLATPSQSAGTVRPVHPPSEADAFAYISEVLSLPVLMLPICGAGVDTADRDDDLLAGGLL